MDSGAFTLFLSFFSFFVITLGFLLLLGTGLFRLIQIKTNFTLPVIVRNIFTAYIVVITIYSLIKTQGVTLNFVYVALIVCGVMEVRRNRDHIITLLATNAGKPNVWLLAGMALAVFSWSWFSIYNPDSILHFNYFGDNILYSKISRSIAVTGFENGFYFLNYFDPFYHGPEPYHYFELWGGAVVSEIFGLNHYLALQLVIYPVFFFLILAHFVSYFKQGNRLLIFLAACSLLFVSGLYAPAYEKVPFLGLLRNFSFHALTPWANKLCFFYVFFLSAFSLHLNGLKHLSILCLLGLTVASIISLPIVVVSIIVLTAWQWFRQSTAWTDARRTLVYTLGVFVLIFGFYTVFKRESGGLAGVEITSPLQLVVTSFRKMNLITQRNIVVGGLLHLVLFYLPLIPLFYVASKIPPGNSKSSRCYFLQLILCIIGVSLAGWAFLYREVNSFELFIVATVPFLNCAFAMMIISILNNLDSLWPRHKPMVAAALALVVLVICIQFLNALPDERIRQAGKYSNTYLGAVRDLIQEKNLKWGVSIKDSTMLEEHHLKFNAVYPMGEYITLMDESVAVVNMGDFNTPIDSSSEMNYERTIKAMSSAVFYRFVQKRLTPDQDIGDLQVSFVDLYRIQFMILSAHAVLPDKLRTRVESTLVDEHTQERFVVLKSRG